MSVEPDKSRVLICDISVWQDDNNTSRKTDFNKMKSEGVSGIVIKCGQNIADPDFKDNWKNSKGIFPRGSYWFYSTILDPKVQAQKWLELLGDDLGEFKLWLDLEYDKYNGQYKGWKHWYDLLEELKRLNNKVDIGIYSNYYYWIENTVSAGISNASLNYFKQYPFWIAAYTGGAEPRIPKPFDKYMLWQFTDNLDGIRYGVESKELDGNYFGGTLENFYNETNWGEEFPPIDKQTTTLKVNYKNTQKIYTEI